MPFAPDFQRRLIEQIEPIRGFFLAQGLHHALDLGVFDEIVKEPGLEIGVLAKRLDLDPNRLTGLLLFLQNEGYVVADPGWSLTTKGASLPEFTPWFQMLVGGYSSTMLQLSDVLRPSAPWASRNTTRVGAGSCGIGRYDAVPLVHTLIETAKPDITTIVDLGCGDAGFLMDVLEALPTLSGIGIDPDVGNVRNAHALAINRGMDSRIQTLKGTAVDVGTLDLPDGGNGTCFMTAFVLQEMLEQEGTQAVEKMLSDTFNHYPDARWLVVEMDYQPSGPIMAHGLALGFYNPYFLIHAVTEQRLESKTWWEALFKRLGLICRGSAYPNERVDTTGLQFGLMLSRA